MDQLFSYLIAFVAILSSIEAIQHTALTDHVEEANMNRLVVQQVLQDANDTFFLPKEMRLELLKMCPKVIPTLAEWLYQEWHSYDEALTKEKLVHSFEGRLNDEKIPITFVVLKNESPIGMISLKKETDPEFSDLMDGNPWMGSLQVIPEERRKGIGEKLLQVVEMLAQSLGYQRIYFYTSNPVNVPWYCKRGAIVVRTQPFRGHDVIVMMMLVKKR